MTEATTQLFLNTPARTVDAGTAQLAVRRFGSGPPLLLVHGFPLSGFTRRKVMEFLGERRVVPHFGSPQSTQRITGSAPRPAVASVHAVWNRVLQRRRRTAFLAFPGMGRPEHHARVSRPPPEHRRGV